MEIPKAQQRVQLPQSSGSPNYTINSRTINPYLSKIGGLLDANAKKANAIWQGINKERDVAQAHDAIYKFEEAARSKYAELRSRQGGNAVELTKEYDDWYQMASRDLEGGLTGTNQQTIFKNAAMSRRGRDLESLSTYEIGQHKIYLKSVYESRVSGAKKDAALYSDDPVRIERMIMDATGWADVANPGTDNSVSKQVIADDIMSVAIQSQAERNPQKAKAMLERWRPSLGEKAIELSKDVDKEFLYFEARTRFKRDFNAQYDWVQVMKNVDEDVKRSVMERINSDEAERDHRQNKVIEDQTKQWKLNDAKAWSDFHSGNLTREDLDRRIENLTISSTAGNALKERMRNPATVDNPVVVADLADAVIYGRDAISELNKAVESGDIKTETYLSMRKGLSTKQYKDAASFISRAMKPPEYVYAPDKNQAYADAMKSLSVRVANGEKPSEVANSIIENNNMNVRRTLVGLSRPRFLEGDQNDRGALENAKFSTAMEYQNGNISEEDYRMEINLIQQRIEIVNDMQASVEASDEFQNRLKEAQKNN